MAVQYVRIVSAENDAAAAAADESTAREMGAASHASSPGFADCPKPKVAANSGSELFRERAEAPALVLDPFCGHGTTLALANAWGMDAYGLDLNRVRCQTSLERECKSEEDVFDHQGVRVGPIRYWGAPLVEEGRTGMK